MKTRLSLLGVVIVMILYSCDRKVGMPIVPKVAGPCDSIKYSKDIDPIIKTYCNIACHGPGGISGWDFYTNISVLQTKALSGALLQRAVILGDMPQGGPTLPDSVKAKIKCWIEKGAPNN